MIDVTPFVKDLKGKPAAVYGLGVSGLAAVKALVAAGAAVHAWDDLETKRAEAEKAGAVLMMLEEADFSAYGCLVLAPGVPLHFPQPHPVVLKAREAKVEILGDLEILHRCNHGRRVAGITGTNGKSTTTALLAHILKTCGLKAEVGGNIGRAVLDMTMPPPDGVIVLEISSFQMDLCPTFTPEISVLLNVTPDHIDRHGTLDNYVASKARMFRGVGSAVIGVDDEASLKVFEDVKASGARKAIPVSLKKPEEGGVFVTEERELTDDIDGAGASFALPDAVTLPGAHNRQNMAAAYAAARMLGLAPEWILDAMKTYPGLPHRIQPVRAINGVAYINDSKATNADAAARALGCYRAVYWIVGGRPKEGGLAGLEPYMERVRHAFLIGEAMEDFGSWLDNLGVPHHFSNTLDKAVTDAHRLAQSERGQPGGTGTVLLSPACASWDQFRNFEERGEKFIAAVEALGEDG